MFVILIVEVEFQNCEHHTIGDFCQLCEPGYYGDAVSAGPNGCTKCACPLPENSFSDTCIKVNHGKGYVCNACKPGYTGIYCESCISGYFGNPNVEGGFCDECDCHPNGSKHGVCDPVRLYIFIDYIFLDIYIFFL